MMSEQERKPATIIAAAEGEGEAMHETDTNTAGESVIDPAAGESSAASSPAAPPAASECQIAAVLQAISLTPSQQQTSTAQKHSPRRRKPRAQEVEVDVDDDESSTTSSSAPALLPIQPALPPGCMLRIPLPVHTTGLHVHKRQKQTSVSTAGSGTSTPQRQTKPLLEMPDDPVSATSAAPVSAGSVSASASASPGMIKCDVCNKLLSSPAQLLDHQQGRKHLHMVLVHASGGAVRCELCDKTFNSTLDQTKHLESSGHKLNVQQAQFALHQQHQHQVRMVSPTPTVHMSASASVASGASSPFTVGAGNPYLLQLQPSTSTSAVSSPASHPRQTSQFTVHHVSSSPGLHFCPLCRLRFPDAGALAHHYAGKRHATATFEAQQQAMHLAHASHSMPPQTYHPQQSMPSSAQWQQEQMQMFLAMRQQQQPPHAYMMQPSPWQSQQPQFASPMQMPPSAYPPFFSNYGHAAPSHLPYMSSSDSIHEEESEVGMDQDSVAAGLSAELAAAAETQPTADATPSQDAALPTENPVVEVVPLAQEDPAVTTSTDENGEVEPIVEIAPATSPVAAPAEAPAADPAAAAAPDPNSSRKRKYGRYSPVVVNPAPGSHGHGLGRPRLGHSPVQRQAHYAPPQYGAASHPALAYPMATASVDAMSSASSVTECASPTPCDMQAVYPAASMGGDQWSQWNGAPPPSSSLAPHPDCRAPHYIFVPYIVHVPSSVAASMPDPSMAHMQPPHPGWPFAAPPNMLDSPANYPMMAPHPPYQQRYSFGPPAQQQPTMHTPPFAYAPPQHHSMSSHRRRSSGPHAPPLSAPRNPRSLPPTPAQQ